MIAPYGACALAISERDGIRRGGLHAVRADPELRAYFRDERERLLGRPGTHGAPYRDSCNRFLLRHTDAKSKRGINRGAL
jgi:hypothetical protein